MMKNTSIAPPSDRPRLRSAKRKPEVWNRSRRGVSSHINLVSGAAVGVEQRRRKILVDLGAQAADMSIDDGGLRYEMKTPHVLEQHRPGHHLAAPAQQIFQHFIFARLQMNLFALAPH